MSRLAITGAGGFIGSALTQRALMLGHEVVALSRRPASHGQWAAWELGQPLPEACAGVDAVIHLASATLIAKARIEQAVDLDLSGTGVLVDSARALSKPPRFIFLSSQSARAGAKNQYGRSKFAIEALLDRPGEIVVRPGLVYDEAGSSVFGLFERLSRLPAVPSISTAPNIQPIHVGELADAILRIVEAQDPLKIYKLGAPEPMTMAQAIRATAKRSGARPPLVFPAPLGPVRAALWVADKLLRVSPPLTERVDGLAALQPMETASSLQSLGLALQPL